MINLLIKVSNDPILLRPVAEKDEKENQVKTSFRHKAVREAVKLIPVHAKTEDVNMSGTILVTFRQGEPKCSFIARKAYGSRQTTQNC